MQRALRRLRLRWGYLAFARAATFAFVGVSVYTIAVKLSGGGLAGDWLHTALHLVTGLAAAVAAYRGSKLLAALLTGAVAVGYGVLAAAGPLVDGLLLGTAAAVPLATPDHIFHGLLAAGALAALVAENRRGCHGGAPPSDVDPVSSGRGGAGIHGGSARLATERQSRWRP